MLTQIGQVDGSPECKVAPEVFEIWVHAFGSAKAPWVPCSAKAWRVEGLPGYYNTKLGALEAAAEAYPGYEGA